MIVPMARLTVVVLRSQRDGALARLQDLGVLHLAEPPSGVDERLERSRRALDDVHGAEAELRQAAREAAHARPRGRGARAQRSGRGGGAAGGDEALTRPLAAPAGPAASPEAVVAEVSACLARRAEQHQALRRTRDELASLRPLGAFDPAAVRELEERGVSLRLFAAPAGRQLEAPAGTSLHEVGAARGRRYVALVGAGAQAVELVGAEPVPLPEASPAELTARAAELERALAAGRARLEALAVALPALHELAAGGEDRLLLERARSQLHRAGTLAYLSGYCPERDLPRVEREAREQGWGLVVAPIDDAADAPTFIEPPRWARPIRELFGLVGVLPGYDQVDVSIPFLVFFSLFFAMIVGDAGYGALFLAMTWIGRRALPRAPRQLFDLLRLLSVATIVWGLASGNIFGLGDLPRPLQLVRLGWLADPDHVILLSFLIGAVHLSLAHAWNAVRWWGSVRALAQVGWALVIWVMFFLARTLVLAAEFPRLMLPVLVLGVTLIVLFMTPWRRFSEEWFAHAMLPLNLVSAFVDVVSYVRLFAVGAASLAVASAFDQMALGGGVGGPVAAVAAVLVLFFGHALNIALASLGVLVHGVRLNTLEFAGHLGVEWTGRPYRPFAHAERPAPSSSREAA